MRFGNDVGVDLGTAMMRVYIRGQGVILREPSVLAVERQSGRVLQTGEEARKMLGRTPANLSALRPITGGVIADFDMAVKLLREALRRTLPFSLIKPRLVFSVPDGITLVEERAVIQAGLQAGARRVYLAEAPLAAAMGAGLPIRDAGGRMVVNIGAGCADAAVLSMGGICSSLSVSAAGDAIRDAIIRYVRRKHGVLLGEAIAEEAKLQIGCVWEPREDALYEVKGRDLLTGLPRVIPLRETEMPEALEETVLQLMDAIRALLEQTPPEMVADIAQNGILLTGGGSRLRGLEQRLMDYTHIPVLTANTPEDCVIEGMERIMDRLDSMQDGALNIARRRQLS